MKLFSTSSFVIPIILIKITNRADVKIILVFFCATLLKKEVITDFLSSKNLTRKQLGSLAGKIKGKEPFTGHKAKHHFIRRIAQSVPFSDWTFEMIRQEVSVMISESNQHSFQQQLKKQDTMIRNNKTGLKQQRLKIPLSVSPVAGLGFVGRTAGGH